MDPQVDLEWAYRVSFWVCFQLSLGCSCWTFGGCFEPSLLRSSPVKKRLCCFHSLVVGTVVVLLVAIAIVDTTRDVNCTVTSTRDAFVIVGTFLEDVVDLVT